jgi:hypothetical protein
MTIASAIIRIIKNQIFMEILKTLDESNYS